MVAATGEKLLSVQEVAARLQVSSDTVYNYLKRGLERPHGTIRLRHIRLGRYRVPESALDEFLEALGGPGSAVDFTGEQGRRRREAEEANIQVRKRLGLD